MRSESAHRRTRRTWVVALQGLAFAVALLFALVAGCNGQTACSNTQSDPDNCGSCGTACAANQVCLQGTCTLGCTAGTTLCGSSCADLQVDPTNCGACGTACKAGQVCSTGQCQTGCAGMTTLCGSTCVDTHVDPANCGSCGTACGAGKLCNAGKCASTCSPAQTACTTDAGALYCANTQQDNANCGACGNACAAGDVCAAGKCASTCGAGQTFCADDGGGNGAYCANTQTDNANCGTCGNTCSVGEVCTAGKCAIECGGLDGGGEALCTPDGGVPYCANTSTDNANCGMCGNVCDAGQVCTAGTCACAPGLTQCPTDAGIACVNTGSDNGNCGGCGKACMGGLVCVNGTCSSLYLPFGVQTNVPLAQLAGWTQCFTDTYNIAITTPNITSVCTGGHLLFGCLKNGATSLTVMAAGLTSDVEFPTGNTQCSQNNVHTANGVEWYFDNNFSVGFAPAGDTVSLCQCDVASAPDPDKRLCWHTINAAGGYRCGSTTGLNADPTWTRVVYSAP
jgi:hypothetical protein